jgi:hypothetical protein
VRALWGRGSEPITLATFQDRGFRVLAELPPIELDDRRDSSGVRPAT